jgi:hypothetical protein
MANEAGICNKTGQLKKCDETGPAIGGRGSGNLNVERASGAHRKLLKSRLEACTTTTLDLISGAIPGFSPAQFWTPFRVAQACVSRFCAFDSY